MQATHATLCLARTNVLVNRGAEGIEVGFQLRGACGREGVSHKERVPEESLDGVAELAADAAERHFSEGFVQERQVVCQQAQSWVELGGDGAAGGVCGERSPGADAGVGAQGFAHVVC